MAEKPDIVQQIDAAINELHDLGWHLDTAEDYIRIYNNPVQFEIDNRSILTTLTQAVEYARREKKKEDIKNSPECY